MKKIISLILIGFTLSGCSWMLPHREDVVQGNVITQAEVSRLHTGMTTAQVKNVLGTPLLVNLFSANRIEYVYTVQRGHQDRTTTRVTCLFDRGILRQITQS